MSTLWRTETPVLFISTRDDPLKYFAYYYEEIMKQITDQAARWGARTPKWYKYFKLEGYDLTKTEEYNETFLNTPTGSILSKPSYYRSDPKPVESFRIEFTPLKDGKQQLVVEVPGRSSAPENPLANKTWLPDYTLRNYYWDIVEYLSRYLNTLNVTLSEKDKSDQWCLLERWGIGGSGVDSVDFNGDMELYKNWNCNRDRVIGWGGWDTLFRDWHNPALTPFPRNFQLFKDYNNELPRFDTNYFEKILDVHVDLVRPRWILTFPKGTGIGAIDIFSAEYSASSDVKHLIHDGNFRDQNYTNIAGIKFLFRKLGRIMSSAGHIRTFNTRGEALPSSVYTEETFGDGPINKYAIYSGLNSADSLIFTGGFGDPNDKSVLYIRGGSLYKRALPNPPTTVVMGPERGPIKIKFLVPRKYGTETLPIATEEVVHSNFSHVTNLSGRDNVLIKQTGTNKYWNVKLFNTSDPDPNKIYAEVNAVANIEIAGDPAWRPTPTFFKGQIKNENNLQTWDGVGYPLDENGEAGSGFPEYNIEMISSSFARNISIGAIQQYEAQTLIKAYDDRLAGMYNDQVGIDGSGDALSIWANTNQYSALKAFRDTYSTDTNIAYFSVALPGFDVELRRVYRYNFEKFWDADKLGPLNCSINFRYPIQTAGPGSPPQYYQPWFKTNHISIKAATRASGIIVPSDWNLGQEVFTLNLGVNGKTPKRYEWHGFDIPLRLGYGKDLIVICSNAVHRTSIDDYAHSVSSLSVLSYAGDPEIPVTAGFGYGDSLYGNDYGNSAVA